MSSRVSLFALIFAPLTACFEVVIPGEPTAELESGEWAFDIEGASASAGCADMGLDDVDRELVGMTYFGWVDVDDADVAVDLAGFIMEGEIDGSSLFVSGELGIEPMVDYGETPRADEEDSGLGEEDHDGDEGDGGTMSDPEEIEVEEIEDECGEIEETIVASLDARILDEDHMRGVLMVEYLFDDVSCVLELDVDAQLVEDDPCDCDCDCDCGCDDDDEPVARQSDGGEPEERPTRGA